MDINGLMVNLPWKELGACIGAACLAGLTSYSFYAKKIADTPEPYEKAKLVRTVVFAAGTAFVATYEGISADIITASAAYTGAGMLFENVFVLVYRKFLSDTIIGSGVNQVKQLLN